jgi:DNA-binding MarR family transcriptional regulator
VPRAGSAFPDDVLSQLIHRFARSGSLLEPHDHGGVRVSLSEVLALGELTTSAGVSQQELAERLGLEKSTVSRLVAGLESRGWLTRDRDPANRRFARLDLTRAGQAVADRIGRELHEHHRALFSALTAEEREALAVGLTALARVIDEHAARFGHVHDTSA